MSELGQQFRQMLQDFEDTSRNDAVYRKDIEDLGTFKIQWNVCDLTGWQILEQDNYRYEFGAALPDPDITFTFTDPEEAVRLFKGERFREFSRSKDKLPDEITFRYTADWVEVEGSDQKKRVRKDVMTASFDADKGYHPALLQRLPMFRGVTGIKSTFPKDDDGDHGSFIPVNVPLSTPESEVLPQSIFGHFFEKASNIVLLDNCGCRVYEDCQDHDHSIGCMHLGDDTVKILEKRTSARLITKEEAMDTLNRAIDDGLIPLLGRAKGEAAGFGVPDTGHFMSMCFCCTCCCIDGKMATHGSRGSMFEKIFRRMEGVTVAIDEEACTGCEYCLDECVFNGLKMMDDLAVIDQERCLGCGRCVDACPPDAISITIDDMSRVHEVIETLESYVDVTPQTS